MESAKLYLEIENIIRKNLQYAYNKNTLKVYYNISNSFPDAQESVNLKNFSVIFDNSAKYKLKLSLWRIPQTRIYFRELSCPEFSICEFQYFESSIILINNFSSQPIRFKIMSVLKQEIINVADNKPVNEKITIDVFEQGIFYLLNIGKVADLKKQINKFIGYERSINPINKIFSTDVEFLKKVDSLWADIPWISEKGEVVVEDAFLSNLVHLLFSELSFYLGHSYKRLQTDVDMQGDSFYNLLNQEQLILASSTKEKIQQFWDLISLPAFKFKLIQIIKRNTIEIISFLLLASKNSFWWSKIAVNYIEKCIQLYLSEIESLFALVFLLRGNFNITFSGNTTLISNLSDDLLNKTNSLITNKHSLKFVGTKKDNLTFVNFQKQPTISINKKAKIKYDSDLQEVEIYPQTYQYELISTNICAVELDSLKIKIHLDWQDFVVSAGDLRLKFLFKKDRYQISIKGDSRIKNFTINAESLSFKENRYHKTYYVPEKTDEIFKACYFDEFGRSVNIEKQICDCKVGIHAVVQNKYGHIINRINSRKRLSNKNTILNALDVTPAMLYSAHPFDLIIPKGGAIHVNPGQLDSLLSKIYYMDCSLLEKQLCIFLSNIESTNTLQKEFYTTFNFNANFKMLSEINLTFSTINIIVAEKYPAKLLRSSTYFDEVLLKEKGQKKALLTSEKKISGWLKNIAKGRYLY